MTELGAVYKQLDGPYGDFNHSLIVASTKGIKSDDTGYLSIEQAIQSLTSKRDALAAEMRDLLNGASVGHQEQLIQQAKDLLALAGSSALESRGPVPAALRACARSAAAFRFKSVAF